ncbi:hypothetical protein H0H87_000502 [Tephrocybe sp. NHM501043]|nr:hypothetical protein H0H87_000502 [Tephrocybe sp. NHM501043]
MPTISPGDKVLVSGANGFIAIWIVRTLLEKGYAVRGTVRSVGKGKYLEEYFKSYGDKFEIAIVEDVAKAEKGTFDEAVKGVNAIVHTASPFYFNATTVDELFEPAVRGTVGILKSAQKNGREVKRVIVLSSAASVFEAGIDKVFDELDWNELAIREVKEQQNAALGFTKYCASKALAEKAAWDFFKENKATLDWDLSVLNPPYVFGPAIHELHDANDLNTSLHQWYETVLGDAKSEAFLTVAGHAFIDVRDLAEAHALALEKDAAGGERIIVSAGSFVWQDWLDAANSFNPSPIPSHPKLAVGYPGAGATAKPPVAYDSSKAARILGIKYRTKEDVTRDTLADFENRGW